MHEGMAQTLKDFPFVMWDRLVRDGEDIHVYGWIDRETDDYKDFVLISFTLGEVYGFYTSSSKYSLKIARILGFPTGGHKDCERVEDYFDLPNMIKLK